MSCQTCQGAQVAPICIPIEDNTRYSNLAELIAKFDVLYDVENSATTIDTKSLTTDKTLKEEGIIQLKNQISKLENSTSTIPSIGKGLCPNIDWSCVPLDTGCDTNFCTQLQTLINTFYKIDSNV